MPAPPSSAASGSAGAPPSIPRAIAVLGIGCEAGNADACSEAARLLLRESVGANAASAASLQPAPAPAPAPAAPPEPAAVAAAHAHLLRGCHSGDSTAHAKCCSMLGALYLSRRFGVTAPSPDAVVTALERGCAGEQPAACMRLAALHRAGAPHFGIAQDVRAAVVYEKRALMVSGMSEKQAEATIERRGARGGSSGGGGSSGAARS